MQVGLEQGPSLVGSFRGATRYTGRDGGIGDDQRLSPVDAPVEAGTS